MNMLERTKIDGRDATVAYLKDEDGFTPADKATATRVKIIFDDGEVVFASLPNSQSKVTKSRLRWKRL